MKTDVQKLGSICLLAFALSPVQQSSADSDRGNLPPSMKWAASWATAIQSAYVAPTTSQAGSVPAYDPQPDLSFALPNATTKGASNQTFRMIVKPDIWGPWVRIKLSNVFGTQPVTFSAASVALQDYQANLVPDTSVDLLFGTKRSITVPAGQEVYSDAAVTSFYQYRDFLSGKNLAVSFAVAGASGPASYHAEAFTTGYISAPNSGNQTKANDDTAFPFTTTSFFFLSELDVVALKDTVVICAFGDSITDGTFSTLNGNDRWANTMSRQLHEKFGNRISVVNEAIAGNAVAADLAGQPATVRYKRDVLGLAGVSAVVWLEGINDLGPAQRTPQSVIAGYQQVAAAFHQAGLKVVGATLTSAYAPGGVVPANSPLNTLRKGALYNSAQTDAYRKQINAFILANGGTFDATVDFAAATTHPSTGTLRAPFVPSSEGSAGDYLHPNRYGYQTMGTVAATTIEWLISGDERMR